MLSAQNITADSLAPNAVLVVGGGVAGMQAALGLAEAGVPAILVERNAHLGGQVMRLDKVYPTDHCAFCPSWSMARACYDSPSVQVLLRTELTNLSTDGDKCVAEVSIAAPAIDPAQCIFCGACAGKCPTGALLARDMDMTWDPALPPSMRIDPAKCDKCGACAEVCPTKAIDLAHSPRRLSFAVADVIHATGFEEPAPGTPLHAPEFGSGSHPDIFTAMQFEAWHGESRGQEKLLTKSDGREVRRVAFVQCAGARDARHISYCAAVCCMHAMKQARWLKRRQPELDITLFYTDLRASGTGQETYIKAGEAEGIRTLRSRPALVMATPQGGIGVRYEQPESGAAQGEVFDIVVVNGGLAQCPLPGARPAAEGRQAPLACGFCQEPVDVAGAVVQGMAAAADAALRQAAQNGGAA